MTIAWSFLLSLFSLAPVHFTTLRKLTFLWLEIAKNKTETLLSQTILAQLSLDHQLVKNGSLTTELLNALLALEFSLRS